MIDESHSSASSIQRDKSWAQWLALAGVAGPMIFVIGFTVAGLLRPGYSPIREVVSALGVGANAWLQNSIFGVFGALLILFSIGLYYQLHPVTRGRWLLIGCLLLLIGGAGMALSGIFTEEPATHPLHIICGFSLGFASPIVAFFLFGRHLETVKGWRGYGRYSLLTGIVSTLLLLFSFVVYGPRFHIGGLIVRILVLEVFAWHVIMGWRLFWLSPR